MEMSIRWLTKGFAAVFVGALLFVGQAAEAKKVAVRIENASEQWQNKTAVRAAEKLFHELGYEVVADSASADLTAVVTVEKAYSHHGTSPTFLLLGGLPDLWNYDSGHATVTTVVQEGGSEVVRQTGHATARDAPIFAFFQAAKRTRTRALSSAVRRSLKEFAVSHAPAK